MTGFIRKATSWVSRSSRAQDEPMSAVDLYLATPLTCSCHINPKTCRGGLLRTNHTHTLHPDFDDEATGWVQFSLPLKDPHAKLDRPISFTASSPSSSASSTDIPHVRINLALYSHHGRFLRGWHKVHAFGNQYVLTVILCATSYDCGRWLFTDRAAMQVVRCDLRLTTRGKTRMIDEGFEGREVIQLESPDSWWIYSGKEVGGLIDEDIGLVESRLDWEPTLELARCI